MTATVALPPERLAYQLQFTHVTKTMARLPGWSDAAEAAVWGVTTETLQRIRAEFAAAVDRAARALLDEADVAAQLRAFPFGAGRTLVALGDSITDDWQSWCEILRRLLQLARPRDLPRLVNAGISGDTTAQALSRFIGVVQLQPDAVLCLLGTNDARLHGLQPAGTLLDLSETQRNLDHLRRFAQAQTRADWWWITPARVLEERIRTHWFLQPLQVGFRSTDLDAVAALVRARPEPVIDLQPLFGPPVDPELLLDDGLHPSLQGQMRIARAVLARLAAA